ncbi:MAG: 50S ribosomal protein L7/L12 [Candidatus Bipolaricaulota bacterium]|nr:MAG: 50S ribosomal protein L7/L12 [Candidatus Bipolaricaulota bacterium]
MGKEEILQEIESMSVKDLADLVEMIEERFNVSAAVAAPVAVAAAPAAGGDEGGGGGGADTVTVVMTNVGQKKIQVIKEIKEITGKGLKECKELVDSLPATIKEGITVDEANSLKETLEGAGAEVEFKT